MSLYVQRQSYSDAADELVSLFDGIERDLVRRIQALFVHQANKFYTLVLHPIPADGAGEPKSPTLEINERMDSLLAAARERDFDKIAVICHEVETSPPLRATG